MQNFNFRFLAAAVLTLGVSILGACGNGGPGGNPSSNETAATVNGKAITMEEVDRGMKQQTQGQDSKLSQLEVAGARLQVLQTLIQQEVMFQKAEKEGTVPTDDEITAEVNKRKVDSHLSAEEFDKQMTQAGFNEASFRDNIKKGLAIQKLIDKITGKIEAPKDQEITDFYNGNKDAFVKKKGVKLAAIVIDPSNSGEGDVTVDEQSAVLKGNEVIKKLQQGMDFAQLARENSEDPQTRLQGGDLGYISEDEMKQTFPAQLVQSLMTAEVGKILTAPMQGKYYILKIQDRSDKDEALTLESPGIRQQVIEALANNRKQLLAASYQAIAMNDAKVENFLAKKVVDNPNELSGARPAGAANSNANAAPASTPAAVITNTAANSNTATAKPANKAAATVAPAAANANKAK